MSRSFLVLCCWATLPSISWGQWQAQSISTKADFRGLSVVDEKIVWVSGTQGTVGRTIDGGKTWQVIAVPDAEKLDFRDIEAFSAETAFAMSAAPGEGSRIYKTVDGGKTWQLQHKNAEPKAFFDSMAFWDEKHGLVLSDPVNGRFYLLQTADGGKNWTQLPEKSRPEALPQEGAFAASGTCLITQGDKHVWFCTGGAKAARVYRSEDRGQTWKVSETPLQAGIESAGGFSIAFRDAKQGIVVGGDYRKPDDATPSVALTRDGGQTWEKSDKPLPFRSGVDWAKDRWFAVGTSGSDVSADDGRTWKELDREKANSVRFTPAGTGWLVGPQGRIAKMAISAK